MTTLNEPRLFCLLCWREEVPGEDTRWWEGVNQDSMGRWRGRCPQCLEAIKHNREMTEKQEPTK